MTQELNDDAGIAADILRIRLPQDQAMQIDLDILRFEFVK